ncbi:unnamed protein product [Dracunculus medinensis]|uniref:F-box domain-containing protein n=1 Tax=Dracunculus medinensis TaxID=318479 RepID=A0A0N4U704_DRAME|nr:unnamed protein product [Dracunculus medinensis]
MALILPLQLLDSVVRCYCCSNYDNSRTRIIEILINRASIFDVIRWRRVSRAFRAAAQKRLDRIRIIEVRLYSNLRQLRESKQRRCTLTPYINYNCEWHPIYDLMVVELDQSHLAVTIDPKATWKEIKALIHLLMLFKQNIEHLYIDSPIIEILVAEVNSQQIKYITSIFHQSQMGKSDEYRKNSQSLIPINKLFMPEEPFFPSLKSLFIISQCDEVEHLSRLLAYSVSVDLLYHVKQMDLLCLKICVGKEWSTGKNPGMFRHLMRFREWTEANSLGERYFQQFGSHLQKRERFLIRNQIKKGCSSL